MKGIPQQKNTIAIQNKNHARTQPLLSQYEGWSLFHNKQ
jgi:hypothetical protein